MKFKKKVRRHADKSWQVYHIMAGIVKYLVPFRFPVTCSAHKENFSIILERHIGLQEMQMA